MAKTRSRFRKMISDGDGGMVASPESILLDASEKLLSVLGCETYQDSDGWWAVARGDTRVSAGYTPLKEFAIQSASHFLLIEAGQKKEREDSTAREPQTRPAPDKPKNPSATGTKK